MPGNTVGTLLEVVFGGGIGCGSVHEMDLGEALGCARGRVNVRGSEVLGEVLGFLNW